VSIETRPDFMDLYVESMEFPEVPAFSAAAEKR